jgi:hypothetical protein
LGVVSLQKTIIAKRMIQQVNYGTQNFCISVGEPQGILWCKTQPTRADYHHKMKEHLLVHIVEKLATDFVRNVGQITEKRFDFGLLGFFYGNFLPRFGLSKCGLAPIGSRLTGRGRVWN